MGWIMCMNVRRASVTSDGGTGGRTGLVAFPEEAGVVAAAEADVAIEAVVAQVGDAALEPLGVDGPLAEIEVERHVVLVPLHSATGEAVSVAGQRVRGCYATAAAERPS